MGGDIRDGDNKQATLIVKHKKALVRGKSPSCSNKKKIVAQLLLQSTALLLHDSETLFEKIKEAVLHYPTVAKNPLFARLKWRIGDELWTTPSAKDLGKEQTPAVFDFIADSRHLFHRVQRLLAADTFWAVAQTLDGLPDSDAFFNHHVVAGRG